MYVSPYDAVNWRKTKHNSLDATQAACPFLFLFNSRSSVRGRRWPTAI